MDYQLMNKIEMNNLSVLLAKGIVFLDCQCMVMLASYQ